jgi:hypothetical protein
MRRRPFIYSHSFSSSRLAIYQRPAIYRRRLSSRRLVIYRSSKLR